MLLVFCIISLLPYQLRNETVLQFCFTFSQGQLRLFKKNRALYVPGVIFDPNFKIAAQKVVCIFAIFGGNCISDSEIKIQSFDASRLIFGTPGLCTPISHHVKRIGLRPSQ